MIKKFLPLALTLTLGISSCSKTDTPVVPQSGITITSGVLSAYPEKEIAATGLVSLPEVTEISAKVFEGYKTLKTVKAPKLTKIGDAAFKGSALTSLELGATVPTTSDDAFEGTSEEKDLIVPADKVVDFADFAKKHHFKTITVRPSRAPRLRSRMAYSSPILSTRPLPMVSSPSRLPSRRSLMASSSTIRSSRLSTPLV